MASSVVCWCLLVSTRLVMADYNAIRTLVVEKEALHSLGGDIELTAAEKICDKLVLQLKHQELYGDAQPWTRHFMRTVKDIERSPIFKIIKKLPKGGSLHSHLFASASYKYVADDLLRKNNIYVCNSDGRIKLKFLCRNNTEPNCESLTDKQRKADFKDWVNSHLLVSDSDEDPWISFRKIFTFTYDLFSYAEVLPEYVYRVLEEHYRDNIMYLEVRTMFISMYDLNGTTYSDLDFIDVLWKTTQRFKEKYTDFIGMKIIYAQYRRTDVEIVRENFKTLKVVIKKYPGFVAGVDFVGFEEEGTLSEYAEELKHLIGHVNFYFHAGETKRHGAAVDLNILDAVLFDSKRIGHAYALPKHPELMKMVKERNIAIEVCPISNQVLGFISDLRNHPAAYLIARGYPVVICNDDPGNWGAEGLSYDWYLAFMAMSSENSGLKLLKKFAINSLKYSALNEEERRMAFKIWNVKWEEFISSLCESST